MNFSSIIPSYLLVPTGAGLLAHLVYQQRQPKTIAEHLNYLFALPTLISVHWYWQSYFHNPVLSLLAAIGVYLCALSASVTAYRLSPFHPLARYPGPIISRITRAHAFRISAKGQQHLYYHELHKKYGPVVRTGPDHLHITEVDAIPAVLGYKNTWTKGHRYTVTQPPGTSGGLLFMADPAEHAQRRRLWDRAFSPSSLKGYEPMLNSRIHQLVDSIMARSSDGRTLDLAEWLAFFAFDFMGDFALGGAFDMMKAGEDPDKQIETTVMAVRIAEVMGTMPWLKPFLLALPRPKAAQRQLLLSKTQMLKRQVQGSLNKDLFYHLLGEDGEKDQRLELDLITLILEASLAITAGSDTTSMTLASTFFYLMTHPDTYRRLRQEIDETIPTDVEVPDSTQVAKLPYLAAVLNETMRLLPAVSNGVQRRHPDDAETTTIAGNPIPRGTTVQIGTYTIQRDPRYFYPRPNEFWPDRWIVDPKTAGSDFRLNTTAFMPFSVGPTNCVGRRLAEVEMRMVVATLVRKFNFVLEQGWDTSQWEANMQDHFVLARGTGLPVKVTPRET